VRRPSPRLREIPPTAWLDRLEESTAGARDAPDPERVHELRVACGRLMVWLDLGGWRVIRDDLRWLRRSAATVRDMDVLLGRFGSRAWAAELAAQRSLGASDLLRGFAHPRVAGLVQAIAVMPSVPEEAARDHLSRERRRTLRAGKRLDHREKHLGEVHRLRRAVRRLRYVLEWIADAPKELAALQNELGALNDLVIMERLLADRPSEDGIAADRAVVEKELEAHRTRVPELWDDAREVVESL
jgi:CHAD domain-containing protein